MSWLIPHPIAVYPRACGGTEARASQPTNIRGLSPRLRGNLIPHPIAWRYKRSIPAPAGEPDSPF